MSTIMGFDFGLARIGVAVGSLASRHAETVAVLPAKGGEPDWNEIRKLVETWQPSTFVVGDLPHDATLSPKTPGFRKLTKKMLDFRVSLQKRFHLPIGLVDESYSSHEARCLLREHRRAGRSTKIRKGEIDMVAAAVILQSWLLEANPEKSAPADDRC